MDGVAGGGGAGRLLSLLLDCQGWGCVCPHACRAPLHSTPPYLSSSCGSQGDFSSPVLRMHYCSLRTPDQVTPAARPPARLLASVCAHRLPHMHCHRHLLWPPCHLAACCLPPSPCRPLTTIWPPGSGEWGCFCWQCAHCTACRRTAAPGPPTLWHSCPALPAPPRPTQPKPCSAVKKVQPVKGGFDTAK